MDRRTLLIGAGAAALAVCTANGGSSSLPFGGELDGLIRSAMQRLNAAAGLSLAVYSRDGVYTQGFGVTDVTTGEAATADTAFYIASSTKPLTALALASLAAQDKFDLNMQLSAFAPDAPLPSWAGAVAFRELLTHTSGIANDAVSLRLAYTGQHDPGTLWRLLGAATPNKEAPRGTFAYTNTGYNIATILTDRRLGVLWQDLLDREVFAPAGMRRATARMSRAAANGWHVAKPHVANPDGIARVYLEKTDRTMQSAGGVIMSANDAVRWLELMIEDGRVGGRQVVPARAVQATRERIATMTGDFAGYKREAYGLGWYHGPYRDELLLHHFGGFAGARAHVSYLPARGIGVAAFVNDASAGGQLTDAVANYVYDRAARRSDALAVFNAKIDAMVTRRDELFSRVQADKARRAGRPWTLKRPRNAYAGTYGNEQFGHIEIRAAGERLEAVFGALHAFAEAAPQPEAIRVELVPNTGEFIAFEGDGAVPSGLLYNDRMFARVA